MEALRNAGLRLVLERLPDEPLRIADETKLAAERIAMNPPPLPADVVAMAQRLVTAAMNLEEDANSCAIQLIPDNFDSMLVSAREMHEALMRFFREMEASVK